MHLQGTCCWTPALAACPWTFLLIQYAVCTCRELAAGLQRLHPVHGLCYYFRMLYAPGGYLLLGSPALAGCPWTLLLIQDAACPCRDVAAGLLSMDFATDPVCCMHLQGTCCWTPALACCSSTLLQGTRCTCLVKQRCNGIRPACLAHKEASASRRSSGCMSGGPYPSSSKGLWRAPLTTPPLLVLKR